MSHRIDCEYSIAIIKAKEFNLKKVVWIVRRVFIILELMKSILIILDK